MNPPADRELLWPILPHLDLFAPAAPRPRALTGETEPAKMVAAFREHMTTRPDRHQARRRRVLPRRRPDRAVHVPAYKIKVVDTTGAGDTWFGGLLTALIKGMPLEPAGRFANRAAADCCTALARRRACGRSRRRWRGCDPALLNRSHR